MRYPAFFKVSARLRIDLLKTAQKRAETAAENDSALSVF